MNGQLGEQVAEDDVETGIGPVLTLLDLRVRCVKGDIIECVCTVKRMVAEWQRIARKR